MVRLCGTASITPLLPCSRQLWRWTDQKELVGKRGGKEFLPAESLDLETLGVSPKPVNDVTLPETLLESVIESLAQKYG